MQIHISTDNHIKKSESLTREVEAELESALGRFGEQITRAEVHLSDLNGPKAGVDKRCLIEIRLAGHQPVVVSHDADNVQESLSGAAEKARHLLESTLGRLSDRKGRTSMGGEPGH